MDVGRILLGQGHYFGDKDELLAATLLFHHECCFKPFQPVLVKKSSFEQAINSGRKQSPVDVFTYFPSVDGSKSRRSQTMYATNIMESDPKRLIEGRRVLAVEEFDYSKIDRLATCVKDEGVVTFLIEDIAGANKTIKKMALFKKDYKYQAFLGHNSDGCSDCGILEDLLTFQISVFDISLVIPIYSKKRVDGLGITMGFFWPKYSEKTGALHRREELSFVVSKYPDNLLFVDGEKVTKRGFPGSEYVQHYTGLLQREEDRRRSVEKSRKSPKKDVPKASRAEKKAR